MLRHRLSSDFSRFSRNIHVFWSGIDARSLNLLVAIEQQSPDIAGGVHGHGAHVDDESLGAGDQGLMFGFVFMD